MAHIGKTQLTFVIIAPPDLVAEGDRLFAAHQKWMAETHPREGGTALLAYSVSKSPELTNPMDAASKQTGNTVFVLNETYETPAGVQNHMELAESWPDFPAIGEWLGKCKMYGIPTGSIFNSLW